MEGWGAQLVANNSAKNFGRKGTFSIEAQLAPEMHIMYIC